LHLAENLFLNLSGDSSPHSCTLFVLIIPDSCLILWGTYHPYAADDGRNEIDCSGVYRVLRGGSAFTVRDSARAVSRANNHPAIRDFGLGFGFRLVCEL